MSRKFEKARLWQGDRKRGYCLWNMKSPSDTIYGILRETGPSFFQHNSNNSNGGLDIPQNELEKHWAVKAISKGKVEINTGAFLKP